MSESALRYLKNKRIGIIGAGNMGEALLKGLMAHGSWLKVKIFDINPKRREYIKRCYRVDVSKNSSDLVDGADIIVFSIKPQEIDGLLNEIAHSPQPTAHSPLFISIAAGITTRYIEARLGKVRVIRVMPNISAKVGESISCIAKGLYVTKKDVELAKKIFESVGDVVEAEEDMMDIITAISGSGPAYFFYFTQALIKAGHNLGLTQELATRLASKTLSGAGRLLIESRENPATLVKKVASKGGTTEAALEIFAKKGLDDIVISAVKSAAKRSRELAIK